MTIAPTYNACNWYWTVAGSTTQVFASGRAAYVPVSDATYQTWVTSGGTPTRIATEQELWDVLAQQCPAGLPVGAGGTAAFQLDQVTKDYIARLQTNTVTDIDAWLDANTGSVTQIRAILKMIVRVQAIQVRKAAL